MSSSNPPTERERDSEEHSATLGAEKSYEQMRRERYTVARGECRYSYARKLVRESAVLAEEYHQRALELLARAARPIEESETADLYATSALNQSPLGEKTPQKSPTPVPATPHGVGIYIGILAGLIGGAGVLTAMTTSHGVRAIADVLMLMAGMLAALGVSAVRSLLADRESTR